MAKKKRRTKKDKMKAKARQEVASYSFETPRKVKKTSKKKIEVIKDDGDKKLIVRDLVKTGLISLLLFGLLMGVYLYLN